MDGQRVEDALDNGKWRGFEGGVGIEGAGIGVIGVDIHQVMK